jgi:hypothetical protein
MESGNGAIGLDAHYSHVVENILFILEFKLVNVFF